MFNVSIVIVLFESRPSELKLFHISLNASLDTVITPCGLKNDGVNIAV